jgi:hypothetical protein
MECAEGKRVVVGLGFRKPEWIAAWNRSMRLTITATYWVEPVT